MAGLGEMLMVAMATAGVTAAHVGNNTNYCDSVPDQINPPAHPEIADRYTCTMEVVARASDSPANLHFEMTVEEVYDGPANLVSTVVLSANYIQRYLLDWNTKQMVFVHKAKDGMVMPQCQVRPLNEAIIFFPPIWGSGANLSLSHIVGPGALLGVLNWTQTHYKGEWEWRGMNADRWDWCGLKEFEETTGVQNVSMATYWSSTAWNMPVQATAEAAIPLGWELELLTPGSRPDDQTHEAMQHNIMKFLPDEVDPSAFRIPEDVFCNGLKHTKAFPNFDKDRLFTFSMEMKMSNADDFTWADGWYDFEKQLYRIDHEVVSTPRERITTTDVFDFNDGLSFSHVQNTFECRISILNDTRTDWSDITGLGHLWGDSPNAFFGSDRVNYTYYGPRLERYMEGDEFRAVRTDWPPDATTEANPTLWHWTFAGKNVTTVASMGEHLYMERQVPIGLRVTAVHAIETSAGKVPAGTSFVYQLYDFNIEEDARQDLFSDGGAFDVYSCYSANWRDHLRFKLDVTSWPGVLDTPLLTSSKFAEYWQVLLAHTGTVSTLRITRVQVVTEGPGETWLEFVLLYRHPEIGQLDHDLYISMTPGQVAKTSIGEAINRGDLFFEAKQPNGEPFQLVAVKGSLTTVVETDCSTTPAPSKTTPTPGKTTPTPGKTTPTPGKTTPTTGKTTPTTRPPVKPTGTGITNPSTSTIVVSTTPSGNVTTPAPPAPDAIYSSGDLAGLGIGMLLVGLACGSGGTFLVIVKKVHITIIKFFKS